MDYNDRWDRKALPSSVGLHFAVDVWLDESSTLAQGFDLVLP